MICGRYYLGLDAIEQILPIRKDVFVKEQNIPDFLEDEIDETAVHAVIYKDIERTTPVGVGRMYALPGQDQVYKIGRIAVLKEERKNGYGDFIVRMLTDKAFLMGAQKVLVASQEHAVAFYEKIGFKKTGEEIFEAGVKHIIMELLQSNICKACQQMK